MTIGNKIYAKYGSFVVKEHIDRLCKTCKYKESYNNFTVCKHNLIPITLCDGGDCPYYTDEEHND